MPFPDGLGSWPFHAALVRDLWKERAAELVEHEARKATAPLECIDFDWWLERELERPVPVLGEVICASTRMLIGGPTGVGKSHLALALAGAIASGRGFLHWIGPAKPLAVAYVDGEMARDLIQDRMRDLHRRLGKPAKGTVKLHTLCREDFPTLEGLNTDGGRAFMLAWVDRLKPDVIVLDSRMCLLVGDMKDEEVWTATMPLVWELTRRRVAQIWLDHTGHDAGHIYGSKTKEWQMDVVALLEDQPDPDQGHADISMKLSFTKARRRRPETRGDFGAGTVTLRNDEWSWQPADPAEISAGKRGKRLSDSNELLRRAIIHLASDASVQPTVVQPGMPAVRAFGLVVLRSYLINIGWFIETVDYDLDSLSGTTKPNKHGRNKLGNSLNTLKVHGLCSYDGTHVWPI